MNEQQDQLAALPIGNVLAIAPAGCGKTEALAGRAAAVLSRGEVQAPRKILALTFSNKAKENLARRMATIVGSGWRQDIVVTNFHGLAARLVRAHGRVLGVPADVGFPEEPWRRRARAELGITYRNSTPFEMALQSAKAGPFDDDEVLQRLVARGNRAAIVYEERLRAENRLDHDDLIRHAVRLLRVPGVRSLYRAHFALTMVDEVQDLSPLQFEMVRRVGGDSVTYAGDQAQGIYGFAGARPDWVFEQIESLSPEVVEFNLSYRSSPAVLRAVNALGELVGSAQLECGDPARWPDDGQVISIERADKDDEARAVLELIEGLTQEPRATIGIVGRRGSRADAIRQAATNAGISYEDWMLPTHVPAVVELLVGNSREAVASHDAPAMQLDQLADLCRASVAEDDAATLDELASALQTLAQMVAEGTSLSDAVEACRVSTDPGAPVAPGAHVLSGHKGKGQEFDWVVVAGLEDGQVPDFRTDDDVQLAEELRVLHVMVSRARYGLAFTYARRDGRWDRDASPWLETLRSVATHFDHG